MTLEELVANKKLSHQEHRDYVLFALSEAGRNYLNEMVIETFMDCAAPPGMTEAVLGYAEGRRSIFREIKMNIYNVEQKLKEASHD